MASQALDVVNMALLLTGSKKLDNLSDDTKSTRLANEAYDDARNEMFELPYDWKFATIRAELTTLYRLTVDTAPADEAWSAGATITGSTSGETAYIVSVESDTVYLVNGLTDDFTDGEELTDGTNAVDCATGYPVVTELEPVSGFDHQYVIPSACKRLISMVNEEGDDVQYAWRREVLVDAAGNELAVLLTDEASDIFIKYIHLVETVSFWPAWFTKLVYINLAIILCEPLKQDKLKKNQLIVMFEQALEKAIEANGLEDTDVSSQGVPWDAGNTDVVSAGQDWGDIDRNRYRRTDEV